MCGIIGYVGGTNKAVEVILDGLTKLEYRGYDSAGIAIIENGKIFIEKKSGKLENLKNVMTTDKEAYVGIGHTRWATHGVPTDKNAHPHLSYDKKIAVVHNGIIENYSVLKEELINQGCEFTSDTDTEVVAHLYAKLYNGNPLEAMVKLLKKIRGTYALGIVNSDDPDRIVCARKDSPLIIGIGQDKNFIASDVPAILKYTRDIIFLDNEEIAIIEQTKVTITDKNGNELKKDINKIEWDMDQATKSGYPHFMLKEIDEEPKGVEKTLEIYVNPKGDIDFGETFSKIDFDKIEEIDIVACGTAYYAGLQGGHFLKKFAKVRTSVEIASEFRYSDPYINDKHLVIFISQSGETLDTLMALKTAREKNAKTLAITNVLGSSISREADLVIYTLAGPEISVASTKAYITQVVMLYLLSLYIGLKKKKISKKEYDESIDKIYSLGEKIGSVFFQKEKIKKLAIEIKDKKNGFYIGRGIDEKIAREGALKMKEISYIHTEAFPGGELKHGTIALIEKDTMVIVIDTQKDMVEKMISNAKEVKARGAFVIVLTQKSFKEMEEVADRIIYIDDIDDVVAPILAVVPLQLLAYYVADAKGLDVDKPRNLAKSVTVE
ncbi:MAG: glutamine--fructose-6-phosphate transaminase (isomerizing) [Fusobacteriaceae bacterium]|jgi:glucosamine--fructose-6-phosphate aminotransferase (isomerizing)|nr:glutamine--fructose-6-phosphate transaminase (isomerizing) [Fusobacteriaceae bacterium]